MNLRPSASICGCLLLLFACFAGTVLRAQTPIYDDGELLLKSAAGTNGLVRLTRAEWKEINIARKAQGSGPLSWDEACTNRAANSIAFTTRLVMVETEIIEDFARVNGRRPFSVEILAAWRVGIPEFRRLKYDFSKITDPAARLVIQKFDYEKRLSNLRQRMQHPPSPPPLPTTPDNRRGEADSEQPQPKRAQIPAAVPEIPK